MAILESGIMGPIRNKVGGYVSAKWKGINYVRSYVVPSNPQTPAQTANRSRFGAAVGFAKQLLVPILRPYWDPFYPQMSGFNAFVKEAMSSLMPDNTLFDNTLVTKGELETPSIISDGYSPSTGVLAVSYDSTASTNGLATDDISLLIYHRATNRFYLNDKGSTRSVEEIELTIPKNLATEDLVYWIFASRGTGNDFLVSNSVGDEPSEGV